MTTILYAISTLIVSITTVGSTILIVRQGKVAEGKKLQLGFIWISYAGYLQFLISSLTYRLGDWAFLAGEFFWMVSMFFLLAATMAKLDRVEKEAKDEATNGG